MLLPYFIKEEAPLRVPAKPSAPNDSMTKLLRLGAPLAAALALAGCSTVSAPTWDMLAFWSGESNETGAAESDGAEPAAAKPSEDAFAPSADYDPEKSLALNILTQMMPTKIVDAKISPEETASIKSAQDVAALAQAKANESAAAYAGPSRPWSGAMGMNAVMNVFDAVREAGSEPSPDLTPHLFAMVDAEAYPTRDRAGLAAAGRTVDVMREGAAALGLATQVRAPGVRTHYAWDNYALSSVVVVSDALGCPKPTLERERSRGRLGRTFAETYCLMTAKFPELKAEDFPALASPGWLLPAADAAGGAGGQYADITPKAGAAAWRFPAASLTATKPANSTLDIDKLLAACARRLPQGWYLYEPPTVLSAKSGEAPTLSAPVIRSRSTDHYFLMPQKR